MKIKVDYRKRFVLIMILSTIGIVFSSTITDMILYNHGVPNIDYESFLGKDYWQYLLFGLFTLVSIFSFVIAGYELVKGILKPKGVKKDG